VGLPEIKKELAASDNFLVTCHLNPDGDALASLLGMCSLLKAMGKRAVAISPDPVPRRYLFIPGADEVIPFRDSDGQGPFDAVVFLDVGAQDRITKVSEFITDKMKIINIDHHPSNDGFGDAAWVDGSYSATAEMLHELFRSLKIVPDADTALALYVGIITDTGRFRFSNTSSRCLATAAALVELGADPSLAAEKVFYTTPAIVISTLRKFLSRVEQHEEGKIVYSYLNLDELEIDTEGFIDNISGIHDVVISILMQQVSEDKYKFSLRSNDDEVDVSAIASKYNGGGHHKAAGCRIKGTFDDVKAEILDICTKALYNQE